MNYNDDLYWESKNFSNIPLSVFSDGNVSLELNNELSPVLIKSENLSGYLGIIMPLKL